MHDEHSLNCMSRQLHVAATTRGKELPLTSSPVADHEQKVTDVDQAIAIRSRGDIGWAIEGQRGGGEHAESGERSRHRRVKAPQKHLRPAFAGLKNSLAIRLAA